MVLMLIFRFQRDDFLCKFNQKIQNCLLKVKLGTKGNCNMLNSMVKFTFYVLQWMYRLGQNFDQKFKINCLSKKKVLRLIRICRI